MSDLPPAPESFQEPGQRGAIRVVTGSRLHFGLLNTVDPFGGVGLMIDHPETEVVVCGSREFQCSGPDSERVERIARRAMALSDRTGDLPTCRVEVKRWAPAHCGLGSGTQLSMAVAEAVCRWLDVRPTANTLARVVATRGKRSAVGIHGYFVGGLIYEACSDQDELNSIQARSELPSNWCVAILRPEVGSDLVHGADEAERFSKLSAAGPDVARQLRRIACQQLLPAADAGNFDTFSDAVTKYNRLSGELFAVIQGGPYNGPSIAGLIDWLADRGVEGAGQSSWGPGVFAWFESEEKAEPIVKRLPPGIEMIALANAKNEGRYLQAC